MARRPPESALVNACLIYLRSRGCLCWRQNQGGGVRNGRFIPSTRGVAGISDIIGLTRTGRFLAVECKRRPNKLTEAQAEFLDGVHQRGGAWACVYSVDELKRLQF